LIKLQAASPVRKLKLLAGLETRLKLNEVHRAHLLDSAKLAVQVVYGEFKRARHAARQRTAKGGESSIFAPTIHLADIRDLRTFVDKSLLLTERLENGVSSFGALQHPSAHYKPAAEGLKTVVESLARGGPEAEMMEIRWMVERKCMYWDAVAMMNARIGDAGRVEGGSQRPRRHSG
jgi:ATP phosphoribosyltransferase regulatory subunit HisZ